MKVEAEVVRYGLDGKVTDSVLLKRDSSGHSTEVQVIVVTGTGRVDMYELRRALQAVAQ